MDALAKIPGAVTFVFSREQFNRWSSAEQKRVMEEMSMNYSRAQFIAVPRGDNNPESRRLYQAIAAGSIPLILTDRFYPNFPETIDWSSFAISFDMDVVFQKQKESPEKNEPAKVFQVEHRKRMEARMQLFVDGMKTVTPAQVARLRAGVAKARELLRYGDAGHGGMGESIRAALERRRKAVSQ